MNFTTIFGIVTIIITIGLMIGLLMLLYAVIQKTVFIPETKKLLNDMFDVGMQKMLEFTKKMSHIEEEKYEVPDRKIEDK